MTIRWVYLLAGVEDIRGADGERIDQLFRESIRLCTPLSTCLRPSC